MKQLFQLIALLCCSTCCLAQNLLNKTVSVNVTQQPLSSVLDEIGHQGNFHFSYVREIVHADSLVTIKMSNKTIKQVLDQLLPGNFQYKEISNQLIIQQSREKWYYVSGHITDANTGLPLTNASVYERMQLVSTLTNDQGYYRLRLRERDRPAPVMLTVSKELYKDTVLLVNSGHDQDISARIKPAAPIILSAVDINQYSRVSENKLGKIFLSSRQRIQSLNLSRFFANQPYQYSIVPGASTHGKLSSQVVNKVSLNMIGGYSAGLNGVEIAGAFNIDQKDVRYAQFAPLFNVVGGKMEGFQVAGLHNQVYDSVKGFQASGISNIAQKGFSGLQVSGVYNGDNGNTRGMVAAGILNLLRGENNGLQVAGVSNISVGPSHGVQVAGLYNYQTGNNHGLQIASMGNVSDTTNGVQISGLFNFTRILRGVQIGIVNIADTSDGYSIGLITIVKKGYHKLLVYNTELLDVNLAYKSGNKKLYGLIIAGASLNNNAKAYSFGYGIGKRFGAMNVELTEQTLYLGNWDSEATLIRLQTGWDRTLAKGVHFYIGPAVNLFYNNTTNPVTGYKSTFPGPYSAFDLGNHFYAWFGWHVGFSFF